MNNVYAFVVGIDRYDEPKWSFPGPCVNALAVTNWLLKVEIPPENVFVFLDALKGTLDDKIKEIRDRGVVVSRSACWGDIDNFWRKDLRRKRNAGSRLLVYWSGHGFARPDRTRIFICSDYTTAELKNRIFNGSRFLDHLHSPEYQFYGEQIFLADVCATYSQLKFTDSMEAPDHVIGVDKQVGYFATQVGKYATGDDGRGIFTKVALTVLEQFKGWPEREAFSQAMRDAFEKVEQKPYRVGGFDAQGELTDSVFGSGAGSGLYDSLYPLLRAVNLPDAVYRRHYLRTVSDLGMPELNEEQGLPGMIRALAKFAVASASEVPFGLLQFLVRLSGEKELAEPVKTWIAENAAGHGNVLANVRKKLDDELAVKILVVEVSNDDKGGVKSYALFVRRYDLHPVLDVVYPLRAVTDWEDFCAKFLKDIEDLEQQHSITDFQIHFVVDSSLFDQPFHRIKTSDGATLGERHVVLLRQKMRIRGGNSLFNDLWNKYAEELRPRSPSELRLVPVPSTNNADGVLPKQKGICYFSSVVEPASHSGSGSTPEKAMLLRLLNSGVPYLLWMHSLSDPDGWKQVEESFTGWLRELESLGRFPAAVTERRVGGSKLATEATLLWDDPQFNPFKW